MYGINRSKSRLRVLLTIRTVRRIEVILERWLIRRFVKQGGPQGREKKPPEIAPLRSRAKKQESIGRVKSQEDSSLWNKAAGKASKLGVYNCGRLRRKCGKVWPKEGKRMFDTPEGRRRQHFVRNHIQGEWDTTFETKANVGKIWVIDEAFKPNTAKGGEEIG